MFAGILAAAGAGFLWAVMGFVISRTARRNIDLLTLMLFYGLICLAGAWVFMTNYRQLMGPLPDRLGWLSAIMIVIGVLDAVCIVLLQRAMRGGHHGAVWTISKSGFVLPYLTGIWVFGEPATASRLASLGSILASVVCFGLVSASICKAPAAEPDPTCRPQVRSWFILSLVGLFLTGFLQSIAIVPSQWMGQGWTDRGNLRIPIYFVGVAVTNIAIFLIYRRRMSLQALPWALLVSLTALLSLVLIYFSLDRLMSVHMTSMCYPVGMGVCIITFAIYSLLILREPVRPLYVVALLLGVAGVALGALG
jgi:multidrug transporter EmrE-like cation transporter